MSASLRTCTCWAPGLSWRLAADDRFCGLCGQRIYGVAPIAPMLQIEPPALAAYLHAQRNGDGAILSGQLEFRIWGCEDRLPDVLWCTEDGQPVIPLAAELQRRTTLVVPLHFEAPQVIEAGLHTRGLVRIRLRGEPFDFRVQVFLMPAVLFDCWLSFWPDERPEGQDLRIYRGEPPFRTWLQCELPGGIPLQWEERDGAVSEHEAVVARPIGNGLASPVARAAVEWDTRRLGQEQDWQEVGIALRFRGLPEPFGFQQRVGWRRRFPLECRPAALVFRALPANRPCLCPTELVNQESRPVAVRRLRSNVPWVSEAGGFPVCIEPGDSATVLLMIDPATLADQPGPHETCVWFDLGDLGRQPFHVSVGEVYPVRPLKGPLLIDPGPPRIVLGRLATGRQVVYLRCCGDSGLTPQQLGLDPEAYARAAFARQGAETVLESLVTAVRQRVRELDQYEAEDVLLCRHPWMPQEVPGVRIRDWPLLALSRGLPSGSLPRHVARVDAWSVSVLELAATQPLSVRRLSHSAELSTGIGVAVLDCLDRQLGLPETRRNRLLRELVRQVQTPAGGDSSLLWMLVCTSEFLRDYRWGPERAWRRLLTAWWQHFPDSRQRRFDIEQAHEELCQAMQRHLERIRQAVWMPAAGEEPPSWVFLGDAFRHPDLARAVRVIQPAIAAPPEWITWLGRDALGYDPDDLEPSSGGYI